MQGGRPRRGALSGDYHSSQVPSIAIGLHCERGGGVLNPLRALLPTYLPLFLFGFGSTIWVLGLGPVQVIQGCVRQAMKFIDSAPDQATKVALIQTLLTVTEGKVGGRRGGPLRGAALGGSRDAGRGRALWWPGTACVLACVLACGVRW